MTCKDCKWFFTADESYTADDGYSSEFVKNVVSRCAAVPQKPLVYSDNRPCIFSNEDARTSLREMVRTMAKEGE